MAKKINQDLNVRQSQTYRDDLDPTNAESSATSLEQDLNYIRSQLKLILSGPLSADKWYSTPAANINDLSFDLGLTKKVVYYQSELQQVLVPPGYNYVALDTAGYPPSENISLTDTSDGSICAALLGDAGVAPSLITATDEGNLLLIRNSSDNTQILDSSGRLVMGLLQVDSDATDGNSFSLSGDDLAQITFVARNPVSESLEVVSASAIGGKTIEYAYKTRSNLLNAPEDYATLSINFAQPVSGAISALDQQEDRLTVAFAGQTLFSLSQPPVSGGISTAIVNGVSYFKDIHYTIAGLTFVWLNYEFQLAATDELVVRYQVA